MLDPLSGSGLDLPPRRSTPSSLPMPDRLALVVANIEEAAKRARFRLDHFERRGQELAASIGSWNAESPPRLRIKIAEDKLSWEGRWEISNSPFEQWALILSDATHQLRATLDNTLHFIAEQEGASPKQLRDVQFPIIWEKANWKSASRWIAMLPGSVRELIEAIQPFQRDEAERRGDLLWMLARFNNADKHRIILTSSLQPQSIVHQMIVEFEDDPTDQMPHIEITEKIEHGGLAVRHDTRPDRIRTVRGECQSEVRVTVLDDFGLEHGITTCLVAMRMYVELVLDQVLGAWAATSLSQP